MQLAKQFGLRVSRVSVRNQQSRWGSCSPNGHICLNWRLATMPVPDELVCSSTFALPSGAVVSEFDRFGLFTWEEALLKVGKNMARVLANVRAGVV